jgi:electron transfer flavoprotein alpha/beta subunit
MACVEELPAKAVEEATRIAAKSDLEITVLDFTKLRA